MTETESEIDIQIRSIDSRVSRLERINDDWISNHGEINAGIYNQIQELMDQREELFKKKLEEM